MTLLTALRKEWMEGVRTHRLLVVGAVLVLFGLLSPLIAKYTPDVMKLLPEGEAIAQIIPEPTVADAVTQYVKNITQFGILLALLLAMGSVAREKDKGTAAMLLVKPLPRLSFLLAKFKALGLMFTISIAFAGVACYYYTMLLFSALDPWRWLVLNALMILYLSVYLALTLLCSVLTKSQAAAGGLALGMLFFLGILGAIPGLGQYLPGQLPVWGGALMAGSQETYWTALWVSVGIIVAALLAAWLVFERQEL